MQTRRLAGRSGHLTRFLIVGALLIGVAACQSQNKTPLARPSTTTASVSSSATTDETSSSDSSSETDASGSGTDGPLYEHVDLPGLVLSDHPPLVNNESVATGTLDNGLRYFVQNNDNPGGSAELRLAINAGSVDEQGPTGVAHFVEHMMFNGTEAYPKNELVNVLRGFGAQFGADVNAYTDFDETVYELNVPTDNEALPTGLNVLAQWLSHATFDPAEVEAERGIVLDEWRTSTQTTQGRLFDIAVPLYYAGTAYADRLTIGSDTDIQTATVEQLREYYDQWYRPANASVVVVGDVDVEAVVQQITDLFAPAAASATPEPARPDTSMQGIFSTETPPGYALHADPDQPTLDVEIGLPIAALPADDPLAWQAQAYDGLIFDILVRRLQIDVDNGTAPFDKIGPGSDSYTRYMDAPALYAFTDAARGKETMQALLDEYERAARYGFDEAEVAVSVDALQVQVDSMKAGEESTQDKDYAERLVEHALTNAPNPSVRDDVTVSSAILKQVTPEALHQRFLARWTNTAPYMIVSVPESDASSAPTQADFDAAVKDVRTRELTPREVRGEVPDQLMARPTPVAPTKTEQMTNQPFDVFDPVLYTYPNGVSVILNPSTIVEGQVYLAATSSGGRSVLEASQVPDAVFAPEVVLGSGVGELNRTALSDVMASADIELSAAIDTYTEGFSGTFASRDAETALAYMNLLMTAPHVDDTAIKSMIASYQPFVDDPSTSADYAGADALVDARYGDHSVEMVLPSKEEFATVDAAGMEAVWKDRFSNASDWVFVFSGDFSSLGDSNKGFLDLVNSYIGTLPSSGPDRPIVDVSGTEPAGVVAQTINAGTGDTASATIVFEKPLASLDGKTQATMSVADAVINARLTTVVREQFGASYSPSAYVTTSDDPDLVSLTYIFATGAPDSMDALNKLLVDQITDLAANGPSPDEFSKALAETTEQYGYVNNEQFLQVLTSATLYPDRGLDTFFDQFDAIDTVEASDVQNYIAQQIPTGQYIDITVLPVAGN